jgi:hypothetical protein
VNTTFQTVLVSGGLNNQNDPGGEVSVLLPFAIGRIPKLENYFQANLDIQYGEAMSFPTPNIYYR